MLLPCEHCGYDLTGHANDRPMVKCPECGRTTALLEARRSRWMGFVPFLCVASGPTVLVALLMLAIGGGEIGYLKLIGGFVLLTVAWVGPVACAIQLKMSVPRRERRKLEPLLLLLASGGVNAVLVVWALFRVVSAWVWTGA